MEYFILKMSIILVPGLMAITCHEVSHGLIAFLLGDNTARNMGRLTLNPVRHLDVIGTLMLFIVHFGWAKPVPVNFNNLRNPKRDMIWVAIAGPVTNFILAALSAFMLRAISAIGNSLSVLSILDFKQPVIHMLAFSVYINLLLGVFNLIPIPPLDGGRVAVGMLPYRQAVYFSRIEPYGFLIVIILVLTPLFSTIILPILSVGIHILAGKQSHQVFDTINYVMSLPGLLQALKM
jgi:Zn-dependent protease